jgi:hypothetical protein
MQLKLHKTQESRLQIKENKIKIINLKMLFLSSECKKHPFYLKVSKSFNRYYKIITPTKKVSQNNKCNKITFKSSNGKKNIKKHFSLGISVQKANFELEIN